VSSETETEADTTETVVQLVLPPLTLVVLLLWAGALMLPLLNAANEPFVWAMLGGVTLVWSLMLLLWWESKLLRRKVEQLLGDRVIDQERVVQLLRQRSQAEADAQHLQTVLDRVLAETGWVVHDSDDDCVGCGCRCLTPTEAVASLRLDRDRWRQKAADAEAKLERTRQWILDNAE
jgi:hypothetical protein